MTGLVAASCEPMSAKGPCRVVRPFMAGERPDFAPWFICGELSTTGETETSLVDDVPPPKMNRRHMRDIDH